MADQVEAPLTGLTQEARDAEREERERHTAEYQAAHAKKVVEALYKTKEEWNALEKRVKEIGLNEALKEANLILAERRAVAQEVKK
jgi:hypothetical protein